MKHRSYSKLRVSVANGQQNIPIKMYPTCIDIGVTPRMPFANNTTIAKLEILLNDNNTIEGIPISLLMRRVSTLGFRINNTVDKLCALYCVIYESRLLKKNIKVTFMDTNPREAVDYAASQHNKYK